MEKIRYIDEEYEVEVCRECKRLPILKWLAIVNKDNFTGQYCLYELICADNTHIIDFIGSKKDIVKRWNILNKDILEEYL